MTKAQDDGVNYDYDKFLSDSSDDSPKLTENQQEELLDAVREASFPKKEMSFPSDFDGVHHVAIKQADDDMNYQQAYSNEQAMTALQCVVVLAQERACEFDSKALGYDDAIETVWNYFLRSGEAVNNNLHIAKENRE